jgi:hypothetical protein
MSIELLIDRFTYLPENLQAQVMDYIEFLIDRHSDEVADYHNQQEE